MNDARPYASLSSGLLARKGTAKPAMRPQGFTGGFEDLGWNDMGHGAEEPDETAPVEHVPSKITALTPAPKKPALSNLEDEDYEGEEGEEGEEFEAEAEESEVGDPVALNGFAALTDFGTESEEAEVGGHLAQNDFAAPMDFGSDSDHEDHDVYSGPDNFAAPMDFGVADHDDEEDEAIADAQAGEPHLVAQRRAILESFDGEEEADTHPPASAALGRADKAEVVPLPRRASAADGRKAAFTLRLDGDRHLRLRLACAVTGRSAQQIVTGALDSALAAIPEIEALASRVPAKTGSARAKRN